MEKQYTTLAQLVLPSQANPAGNVHGGEIMKLMDSAAAVAAQRYSHTNVVTAHVDELNFKHPVYVGDFITCKAQVIFTGRTSMEVFVTVETENLQTGAHFIAQTAFFTMVSLGADGKPQEINQLALPEEAYERALYYEGEKRRSSGRRRCTQK